MNVIYTRDNCSVVAAAAEERSAAVASLNNEREGDAGWGVFSLSNGDGIREEIR